MACVCVEGTGVLLLERRGVHVRRGGGRAVFATIHYTQHWRVVCACVLGTVDAARGSVTGRHGKARSMENASPDPASHDVASIQGQG